VKEKFPDTAREGGRPSAAGYNARSRVLERLAAGAQRHSVHTDAFQAQREVQGQPPLLVRVIYDVVPKFVDDMIGPQLPDVDPDVAFSDEPGDVDPDDEGPDVGAVPPDDVEEDPFDPSFRDESEGTVQDEVPPGDIPAQTGCNAAVLQWDEQEQEWFDTDEYIYVENPHNTVYDRDETALVLWHQPSGSYAFAERSTWHYGLTDASPAGPPPAPGVPAPAFYPDAESGPDTYAVTFVKLPNFRHPGFNGVRPVPMINGPHAVVQNVRPGAPYLPQGSLVLCRRQGGHWYMDEGEAVPAGGSGSGPAVAAVPRPVIVPVLAANPCCGSGSGGAAGSGSGSGAGSAPPYLVIPTVVPVHLPLNPSSGTGPPTESNPFVPIALPPGSYPVPPPDVPPPPTPPPGSQPVSIPVPVQPGGGGGDFGDPTKPGWPVLIPVDNPNHPTQPVNTPAGGGGDFAPGLPTTIPVQLPGPVLRPTGAGGDFATVTRPLLISNIPVLVPVNRPKPPWFGLVLGLGPFPWPGLDRPVGMPSLLSLNSLPQVPGFDWLGQLPLLPPFGLVDLPGFGLVWLPMLRPRGSGSGSGSGPGGVASAGGDFGTLITVMVPGMGPALVPASPGWVGIQGAPGGGTVTYGTTLVGCSPAVVSQGLQLTVTGATGTCGCLVGTSATLIWNSGPRNWAGAATVSCGGATGQQTFTLICPATSWGMSLSGVCFGNMTGASSFSPSPFSLTFNGLPVTAGGCSGTVNVTILPA
jgi:hypothetical protein